MEKDEITKDDILSIKELNLSNKDLTVLEIDNLVSEDYYIMCVEGGK